MMARKSLLALPRSFNGDTSSSSSSESEISLSHDSPELKLPLDTDVGESLRHVNVLLAAARRQPSAVATRAAEASVEAEREVQALRVRAQQLEEELVRVRCEVQQLERENADLAASNAALATARFSAEAQLTAARMQVAMQAEGANGSLTPKQRAELRSLPKLRDDLKSFRSEVKELKNKRRRLRNDMIAVVTGAEEADRLVVELDTHIHRLAATRPVPPKLRWVMEELDGVVKRVSEAVFRASGDLVPSDDEYTHSEY